MKKLRAGKIQGMAATIQPTSFGFPFFLTKYILTYLLHGAESFLRSKPALNQ